MSTVIITTNNVGHYGITLVFDSSNPLAGVVLKNKEISLIFNRYGDWESNGKISLFNSYLLIPYRRNEVYIYASYNLDK